MPDIQWFTDRLAPTLGEEIAEVIPLGTAYGSNQVFKLVTTGGRHYIAKFPKPVRDAMSPFWRQLAALFGCTIDVQLRSLPRLVDQLNTQQVLPVPQVIHVATDSADLEERFSLVTYIAGQSYEPDEFPPSAGLHAQLGQFVGALHARTYPGFGNIDTGPARHRAEFLPLATATMKQIISDFWHNHSSLLAWLARATETIDNATFILTETGSYLCPNQHSASAPPPTPTGILRPKKRRLKLCSTRRTSSVCTVLKFCIANWPAKTTIICKG
jgi:hypothetical protein